MSTTNNSDDLAPVAGYKGRQGDRSPAPRVFEVAVAAEPIQLRAYWQLVRRRIGLVFAITVILTGVIAVLLLRMPNYYDARTRIEINPEGFDRGVTRNTAVAANSDPTYLNTQLQTITSARLLRRVAKALRLDSEPAFTRHMARPSGSLSRLLHLTYIGKTYDDEYAPPTDVPVAGSLETASSAADFDEARQLSRYVAEIRGRIRVEPIKETRSLFRETRLVDIVVRHQSPRIAARISNAIGDAVVMANNEQNGEADKLRTKNLMNRANELQLDIRKAELRLGEYGKSHEILSLEPGQNMAVDRLVALNKELLEGQNELRLAEANYQTALQPAGGTAFAEENIRNQIAEASAKLTDLRARRAQLLVTATEKWPEVQEVNRQMEVLEQRIEDIRARGLTDVVAHMNARLKEAQAREQAERTAFDQQRALVQTQNDASVNYRLIQQEIETNKRILNALLENVGGTEAMKALAVNNIRVVDYALTPDKNDPQGPLRLAFIALAGVGALLLGITGALLLGALDSTIRSDSEIFAVLHARTMGEIAALHSGFWRRLGFSGRSSRPRLLKPHDYSSEAEDYRRLRASVIRAAAGRMHCHFLLTSSVPGEGKSTTSANLAVSLAQTGASVLLVDADLRAPQLHTVFGLENTTGLSSLATGPGLVGDLEKAIRTDTDSGLHILPAGPAAENPAELLGSETTSRLLQGLKLRYDYVIVDTASVESCVDPLLLASRADGVLLVVRSGKTSREVVRRSWRQLEDAGANLLGVVLNRTSSEDRRRYAYTIPANGSALLARHS